MTFTCQRNLHHFRSEAAADACPFCRRAKDAAVRRHFKRISDELLQAAGVEPLPSNWSMNVLSPGRNLK